MDFRMLHRLCALYHSKVHHIGNESEGLVVILQGMAIGIRKSAVFLKSGEHMLNRYPDSPLFCIVDLLGTGELCVLSGSFEWNERMQFWEILLDSLIARVAIEPRILWDDPGKD